MAEKRLYIITYWTKEGEQIVATPTWTRAEVLAFCRGLREDGYNGIRLYEATEVVWQNEVY